MVNQKVLTKWERARLEKQADNKLGMRREHVGVEATVEVGTMIIEIGAIVEVEEEEEEVGVGVWAEVGVGAGVVGGIAKEEEMTVLKPQVTFIYALLFIYYLYLSYVAFVTLF